MEYNRGLGQPLSIHQHPQEDTSTATSLPTTDTARDAGLANTSSMQHDASNKVIESNTSSDFARSTSSTSTAREEDVEALRRQRSKELGSPSDKQYKRAGMAGVGAVGAGAGVAGMLAHHGETTPAGWRNVDVDGKHQLWSFHLASPRKSAFKVCA